MKYALEIPEGFGTVLADPPWPLRSLGYRKMPYGMMSLDEIKEMPVQRSRASHLWLWASNPCLPEALEVAAAWGFQYKTMATWVKPRMGLGWWLRSRTEQVIFAVTDGALRTMPRRQTTLLQGEYRGHSRKPEELLDVIEVLSPGPYLELFASPEAPERPGWTRLSYTVPPV